MSNLKKYLAGSPYYMEKVLNLNLAERAKNGILTHLVLNQPPICNSHCRRCFMPNSRRGNVIDGLNIDEYKKIIKDSHDNGILCIEISGEGEPLLSKSLKEIIQFAFELGFITTLITNGHYLTTDFINYVAERNVTLVISLFSIDQGLYELDNGLHGSHKKIIEKIIIASDIYRDRMVIKDGNEVFRIAIHTTVQIDNIGSIEKIRAFCDKYNIFFSMAPLALVGEGVNIGKLKLSSDRVEDIEKLGHNSIILSHTSESEIGRKVCGTCLYGLNIGYDGNLLFDAHAGYEIGNYLGNVRSESIKELIRIQKSYIPKLFNSIDSFCPIRDPKWNIFLKQFMESSPLVNIDELE